MQVVNAIPSCGIAQNSFKNDSDVMKFVQHLIINNFLKENLHGVDERLISPFITLGSKGDDLKNGKIQLFLPL